MGYVKPIPVKQEKLIVGNDYYTCNYTGTVKVTLLKIFADTKSVLVKVSSKRKEHKPFVRSMRYIFDDPEMAKFAGRSWEEEEKKRKKK